MGIVGWATVALVVGGVAHMLYDGTTPEHPLASLLLGTIGISVGAMVSTSTGIGEITSPASVATWLTALTCACLVLALLGVLRAAVPARRGLQSQRV